MKNSRIENLARLVVSCEKLAETREEYEMLHDIYLDLDMHYYEQNQRHLRVREYIAIDKVINGGLA